MNLKLHPILEEMKTLKRVDFLNQIDVTGLSNILCKRISELKKLEMSFYESNKKDNKTIDKFTVSYIIWDANIGYIRESLNSILNQSDSNIEVVLMDNGLCESSQDTQKVLYDLVSVLIESSFDFKYIKTSQNYFTWLVEDDLVDHWSNLMNAMLLFSTGKYFSFLSWDDVWSDNYISEIRKLFELNRNCTTVAPSIQFLNADSSINVKKSSASINGNQRDTYTQGIDLVRDLIGTRTKFSAPGDIFTFKRDLLLKTGGIDRLTDLTQILKHGLHGESGLSSKAKLYWRHHEFQTNKELTRRCVFNYQSNKVFFEKMELEKIYQDLDLKDLGEKVRIFFEKSNASGSLAVGVLAGARHGFSVTSTLFRQLVIERLPLGLSILIIKAFVVRAIKFHLLKLKIWGVHFIRNRLTNST